MARIRTIKPDFFVDDEVAKMTTLARLVFVGLWTAADREGRLEDRPARLKVQLAPYDDCDMDAVLTEIAEGGFITRYASNETEYIEIRTFTRHQRPHPKEPVSIIPQCLDKAVKRNGETLSSREKIVSSRVDLGREGKGMDISLDLLSKPAEPPFMTFPISGVGGHEWNMPMALLTEYEKAFPALNVRSEMKEARAWLVSNPRRKKTRDGMPRYLCNWLGRAQNRYSGKPNERPERSYFRSEDQKP